MLMKKKGYPADRQEVKKRGEMKVKRRVGARKALTAKMIENLIQGFAFVELLDGEKKAFKNDSHRRTTWLRHGKYIIETYRDYEPLPGESDNLTFESGTRPSAWRDYGTHNEPKERKGEFAYLKKHDLLLAGEEIQYLKNQKEKAERIKEREKKKAKSEARFEQLCRRYQEKKKRRENGNL